MGFKSASTSCLCHKRFWPVRKMSVLRVVAGPEPVSLQWDTAILHCYYQLCYKQLLWSHLASYLPLLLLELSIWHWLLRQATAIAEMSAPVGHCAIGLMALGMDLCILTMGIAIKISILATTLRCIACYVYLTLTLTPFWLPGDGGDIEL